MQIIAIFGPTGIHKSQLAIDLFNPETVLISVDSRKAISELNIGTNKMPLKIFAKKTTLKLLGLDLFTLSEHVNVAKFLERTLTELLDILKIYPIQNIILFGGTGLYMSTLLVPNLISNIPPNIKIRKNLKNRKVQYLQYILRKLAPNELESMNHSDKHNPYRLIRKIELIEAKQHNKLYNNPPLYLQEWAKILKHSHITLYTVTQIQSKKNYSKTLYERIENMFRQGWLNEVENIILKYKLLGASKENLPSNFMILGYREIINAITHNTGTIPPTHEKLHNTILQLQKNTYTFNKLKLTILKAHLKYAKYQLSWGRRYTRTGILPPYVKVVPLTAPLQPNTLPTLSS